MQGRRRGKAAERISKQVRKFSLPKWFGFPQKPDPSWVEFKRACAGHAALKEDTICALPLSLIDAIKLELPDFFTWPEELFERRLTTAAGGGFFLRRPFTYPPIKGSTRGEHTGREAIQLLERMQKSSNQIKQLLVEDLKQRGRSSLGIQQHFATEAKIAQKIEARKWSYAGWLVTDSGFQKEWQEVRKSWEPWIKAIGGFPSYPTDLMGHSPIVPEPLREFYDHYTQFYQRWCIHTFATWDLPIPMWAGIASPIFYPLVQASDAGMALFIPWYLLRDKTFNLQDLAKHEHFAKGPDHLQGWFRRDENKWGYTRLGRILKLYVCVELCLKKRYPDRVKRFTEGLDDSLCRFLVSKAQDQGRGHTRRQRYGLAFASGARYRRCAYP